MRTFATIAVSACVSATLLVAAADPAAAACTRLGFSVNDYGKDGPTKDAKELLDKYVARWAADRGIKSYRMGKKDVSCELFLNLIVFDEHTCRAEATVCWDGPPVTAPAQSAEGKAPSTPLTEKPAGAIKRASPTVKPVAAAPKASPALETGTVAPIKPAAAPAPVTPVVAVPAPVAPSPAAPATVAPAQATTPAAVKTDAATDQALLAAQRAAAAAERAAAAAERAAAAAAAAEKGFAKP
jgi:hypothetical protein